MIKKFRLYMNKFKVYTTGRILFCILCSGFSAFIYISACKLQEATRDNFTIIEKGYQVRNPDLSNDQLYWRVDRHNTERQVLNLDSFGAVEARCPVLVVQAGRGAEDLQRLISSLSRVRGIDGALLVISHSFYDDQVNRLVNSITFCRVLQIFYPYSLQLHPDRFPGVDPADCLAEGSDRRFCSNRNASVIEQKQHWWWTAHYVFDQYAVSVGHKGFVLFLEEADYVIPDILYKLQYAQQALSYHVEAEVISLGRPYVDGLEYDLLTVDPWRPPYDKGLAFNRTLWKKIHSLAARFCMHDDASWSYSLLNLFAGFPRGHVVMVVSVAPRVLGIMDVERGQMAVTRALLFPARVHSVFLASPCGRIESPLILPPHGNGGWSDLRDQLLCLDPLMQTTTNGEGATSVIPSTTNETVLQ